MKKIKLSLLLITLFMPSLFCSISGIDIIDLSGKWSFRLDPSSEGIKKKWYTIDFQEQVILPGTTDTNKKGIKNEKYDETTFLSREYSYVGKAWYGKKVDIPKDWEGKHIELTLERSKPSKIWVDGQYVGESDNVSTKQVYNLTNYLSQGTHTITIMVDNGESVPRQIMGNSHAYTESTQTNWNGIIGDIVLDAKPNIHIRDVQVYPYPEKQIAKVRITLHNPNKELNKASIVINAQSFNTTKEHRLKVNKNIAIDGDTLLLELPLGSNFLRWSEYEPNLYQLTATIKGQNVNDSQTVTFGIRDFKTKGTQFSINGLTTFLRGKHDACVFPLTGHVAMDVETWRRYFQIAKSYGINHYRFHSWCPPKACFDAADIEGIYLQPELPFWGWMNRKEQRLISFLTKEGINIQNEYGNHASFVMFALGNELSGDQNLMAEMVSTFRNIDSRHLYASGSNNFLGYSGYAKGDDYFTTCRVPGENTIANHARGSFSFADAKDGGAINSLYPNSQMNFESAVKQCSIPIISFETGQFQIYPNYKEIEKYTGVLKPRNFEVFKKRLQKAGMEEQAHDFFEASGKWSVELYRADIEMNLRTKGFGGFQLLDLQDYPGQGSAYVGILDAFMDSKGLITPEDWRKFCNQVVPLFTTEKLTYNNTEKLVGKIEIANYSQFPLKQQILEWNLNDLDGNNLDKGFVHFTVEQGSLTTIAEIQPQIATVAKAQKLNLSLSIKGTPYSNNYPLWIYNPTIKLDIPEGITVTNTLNPSDIEKLKNGAKILWFPKSEDVKDITIGGLFQTDYWNYRMFKTISESNKQPVSPGTLGILTDPLHKIFSYFPTEEHTNWQWFPIIKQSRPMILDRLPKGYKPIVQVIDNIERNHKLGLIFELGIEQGKLLICMSDLEAVKDKPEAKQLYYSILQYMNSKDFRPETSLSVDSLLSLLNAQVISNKIEELKNVSYD